MAILAQFPLQSVLLPGMPLGLHVFEPRYLQLMEDIAATDGRFGVVMITRGSEVGGADQRAEVGTLAELVAGAPTADGRLMIEAVGVERFRVTRWLDDDPYPRADVEPWTPLMSESAKQALGTARERFGILLSLVSELGADVGSIDVPDGGIEALYGMAVAAPVSTLDRYRILAAPEADEAAAILIGSLDGLVEVLRFRLQDG
ncbi:MAG: LON peptidase substrate-binding domain-containing protein [Acidimicrobiia bacterium]|nr:LON peptidase substrate-binding domain-containing protein [Acidimicrobiia bacterium]